MGFLELRLSVLKLLDLF